jgi:hypothetical protein
MLILIVDESLTLAEKKLITSFDTFYELSQDDNDKYILDLPKVEFYIVNLKTNTLFYARNLELIQCTKIYYKKNNRLENLELFKFDYVIKEFPTEAKDSKDLKKRLSYNSLNSPLTKCTLCYSCIFSNITCLSFCNLCCGVSSKAI